MARRMIARVEIDIEAFNPTGPIISKGVFDAAAQRPPLIACRSVPPIAVEASIGEAACHVDQGAIKRVADTRANRTKILAVRRSTATPIITLP